MLTALVFAVWHLVQISTYTLFCIVLILVYNEAYWIRLFVKYFVEFS